MQTDPQRQIQTDRLVSELKDMSIGQSIAYSAFGAYDVWSMLKARKVAEKETGARFGTLRGFGIKRLATDEIAGIGSVARSQIGRKAKRAFARLSNLKSNDIANDDRMAIDAERSLLGAISVLSKTKSAPPKSALATGPEVANELFKRLIAN